jgi:hypothetical protein
VIWLWNPVCLKKKFQNKFKVKKKEICEKLLK